MRYVGYSEFFHDAGLAIVNQDGVIDFASHSERYSKIKNDEVLHKVLVDMINEDDGLYFYESPKEKEKYINIRRHHKFKYDEFPSHLGSPFDRKFIKHHQSHAAAAFYTRPWDDISDTVIMTIDGAGEIQTATIQDCNFNILYEDKVPKSIGLFYAWTTRVLGFKPGEEEYIVMGMASYGEPIYYDKIKKLYENLKTIKRLEMISEIENLFPENYKPEDVAASVQMFAEEAIMNIAKIARKYGSKLCYGGGVAQNIIANNLLKDLFDEVWIAPCPTDAGSALGVAAHFYCVDNNVNRVKWKDSYLGLDVKNNVNPKEVADYIVQNQYCGLVSGRSEFGPRALGNRSLIADVRYDVKDTVNEIKRRQKFRPFAPAILEEFVDEYFEGHTNEYMQYSAKALHDYKSVTHVDGTARVQVVKKDCSSIFRKVIEEYYELTGVPMLLNTSLNIKGMPIVNDFHDAKSFEDKYNVKVFR